MADPDRVRERFAEEVLPYETVWDVGAYRGDYTRAALDAGAGAVIAFEPQEDLAEKLRERFAGESVGVVEAALYDQTMTGGMEENSGGPSTARFRSGVRRGVKAYAADDLRGNLNRPHVIKIDVEGAEVRVLRGAKEVLARARVVLVEVHANPAASSSPEDYGDDSGDVRYLLERAGYVTERMGTRSDRTYHLVGTKD